jgi:hypothetical protein
LKTNNNKSIVEMPSSVTHIKLPTLCIRRNAKEDRVIELNCPENVTNSNKLTNLLKVST